MKNLSLPELLQTKIIGFLSYTQSFLDSQNELKEFFDTVSPSLRQEVIQVIFKDTLMHNSLINFDPNMVEFLTKKLEAKIHMPDDQIITQGETGKYIYFISTGECEVSVRDHNSVTEVVGVMGKGILFGEVALL